MRYPPILALAALLLASLPTAASTQDTSSDWEAVSYATALEAMEHAPLGLVAGPSYQIQAPVWDVTTPKVVPSYIATTLDVARTPCFNCVHGTTKNTYGTGFPLGYVSTAIPNIRITDAYFDVSFKGMCAESIALTQGTKTLAVVSGTGTPAAGSVETFTMLTARAPTWHGAALMTGKVTCGGVSAISKGVVHFQ
jgi:hypothetical protein